MIYQDHNGSHVVSGIADIQRLNGANFNLAPMIVTDESGQVIGIQGGELSLQKSMTMIKSLREGDALMKSQPVRRTFIASKPVAKTEMLKKSFSSGLADLHRQIASIKRMQNA